MDARKMTTLLLTLALPATGLAQNFGIKQISRWDGDGNRYADVWVDGDIAFLGHFGQPRVNIIDISDRAAPKLLSTYVVPSPNQGASAQDVKAEGGLLYVGLEGNASDAAQIVDVRDPANPRLLTNIFTGGRAHNLFFADGWLYIMDSRVNHFFVFDLRNYDPDNAPARISTIKWTVSNIGSRFVHDITVQGDRLYASAWSGIHVLDVSNIANEAPRDMGSAPGTSTHAAWATDDGRFIAVCEERDNGGLKLYEVVDDGNTAKVTLRDEFFFPNQSAHNPIILGERIYCSWYGRGCQIFEIDRDAKKLVRVGSFNTGTAWGIYPLLGPNKIVIGDVPNGLYILAATIPADMNCDGFVDLTDVEGFLLALIDPDEYEAQNPECDIEAADVNADGSIDLVDVEPFIQALLGG